MVEEAAMVAVAAEETAAAVGEAEVVAAVPTGADLPASEVSFFSHLFCNFNL